MINEYYIFMTIFLILAIIICVTMAECRKRPRAIERGLSSSRIEVMRESYTKAFHMLSYQDRMSVAATVLSLTEDRLGNMLPAMGPLVTSSGSDMSRIIPIMIDVAVCASDQLVIEDTIKYGSFMVTLHGGTIEDFSTGRTTVAPAYNPELLISVVIMLLGIKDIREAISNNL